MKVQLCLFAVGLFWDLLLRLSRVVAGSSGVGDEQRPVGSRPLPGQQNGQQVVHQRAEQVRAAELSVTRQRRSTF